MQEGISYFLLGGDPPYKRAVGRPSTNNREALDPFRLWLLERIEAVGLTPSQASKKIERNHAYLQQFIWRGIPAALNERERRRLALLIRVPEEEIRRRSGDVEKENEEWQKLGVVPVKSVPILGLARAGYWAEATLEHTDFDPDTGEVNSPTAPIVADARYPAALQYALEIDGSSLNKVAPPGSFVICVSLEGYPVDSEYKALDGKYVHVERVRGDLTETTIKRLRVGNPIELWPDSYDPAHQHPIPLLDGKNKTTVQIKGVVIGFFRRA